MGFGIGFTPQLYSSQFATSDNNQQRLALANDVSPNNIGNVAAKDKRLALANVVNFANEEAYKNMDKRDKEGIGSLAASFGGLNVTA